MHFGQIACFGKLSKIKNALPNYYTVVLFSFLDKFYYLMLIKVFELPYAKETDSKLLSDLY